jgi:LysM repeat protein
MNRGQLFFLVLVNAMVSFVIALAVVWAFEARRPDLEELAAINTPRPTPILAVQQAQPTATVGPLATQETGAMVATETPTPDVPITSTEQVYVVQPGDTMLVIATRYDVTVQDILNANNLSDPNFVFAGQRLVIPVQGSGAVTQSVSGADVGILISDTAGSGASTTGTVPQGVRISSITGVGDLSNEQVILVNESDTPYSLQGWQLQRGDGPAYAFRSDVPLYPGGSIRVHTGPGTDTSIDFYWGQSKALWQAGTEAKLVASDGNTVTSYIVQ